MMTSPNDSIFPIVDDAGAVIAGEYGLTKREYFAAIALQGLLSADDPSPKHHRPPELQAALAVLQADTLIAALNGEQILD